MRLAIMSDEAGQEQRARLAARLIAEGYQLIEQASPLPGCACPDYVEQVALAVCQQGVERGMIISERPIGASLAANRFPGIRAALCADASSARLAAEQEGMNVLVLPLHLLQDKHTPEIIDAYLSVPLASVEVVAGLLPRRLQRVLSHINENLSQTLSVAELAQVVGMSQYYFSKLFKMSTGSTPHQYVMRRRVERAQELLRETRMALADVGATVGFETQSHFTSVFRRLVGVTPRHYRERSQAALTMHPELHRQDHTPEEQQKSATAA